MRLSSTIRTLNSNLRRGFTIVELLVAAALSMFIMAILSTAFSKGIDTFRTVRAAGNMQEKLRMASVVIKRDLAAQHFDGGFHPGLSGAFLTDQRLDQVGWTPPSQGYFFIANPDPGIFEGIDEDGIWSTRATSHQMGMTVKLSGQTPDQLFYANCTQHCPRASWIIPSIHDLMSASGRRFYYFALANTRAVNNSTLPFTSCIVDRPFWCRIAPIPTSANGGVFPDMSIRRGETSTRPRASRIGQIAFRVYLWLQIRRYSG